MKYARSRSRPAKRDMVELGEQLLIKTPFLVYPLFELTVCCMNMVNITNSTRLSLLSQTAH